MLTERITLYEAMNERLRQNVEASDVARSLLEEQNLTMAGQLAEMQHYIGACILPPKDAGGRPTTKLGFAPWLAQRRGTAAPAAVSNSRGPSFEGARPPDKS